MKNKKLNMVLLHGWNHLNYNNQPYSANVWDNRRAFIEALQKKYNVHTITFPGFCGQKEPKMAWKLENFADFVEENLRAINLTPDVVLGYSFGAAVALKHKLMYQGKQKLALVSPAILRQYKTPSPVYNKLKYCIKLLPNTWQGFIKDQYVAKILKNPFYAKGDKFIRQSYLNIVGLDLSEDLLKLKKDDFVLIFGEKDTAVPPNILLKKYPSLEKNMIILKGGAHDIANTNTQELAENIDKFIGPTNSARKINNEIQR